MPLLTIELSLRTWHPCSLNPMKCEPPAHTPWAATRLEEADKVKGVDKLLAAWHRIWDDQPSGVHGGTPVTIPVAMVDFCRQISESINNLGIMEGPQWGVHSYRNMWVIGFRKSWSHRQCPFLRCSPWIIASAMTSVRGYLKWKFLNPKNEKLISVKRLELLEF